MIRLTVAMLLLGSLGLVPAAAADVTLELENNDRGTVMVYKMSVTPAAEPVPAMKYRLSVEPHTKIPGNAITHYLRSYGENGITGPWKNATDKFGMEVHDWYDSKIPIKDLPLDKVREVSRDV